MEIERIHEIELDKMRAFCIALSAAITVIIATQPGLPVSSTHIAVGAVFGVGFLREYLKRNYSRMMEQIQLHHLGGDKPDVEKFLEYFHVANLEEKAHDQILRDHLVSNTSDLCVVKPGNSRAKAGPMSGASALGLACVPRLDLDYFESKSVSPRLNYRLPWQEISSPFMLRRRKAGGLLFI
jgi:hypothetical protein